MSGTIEIAVATEGRVLIGMTETATTGREITVEKETGTDECTGMFKVECKMAFLAGGIQSRVALTEISSREGVGGRLVRMLKEF